ncbi:MAG: hypothetical protein H5T91_07195 [Synergistetes bacterium]|nr:MAG: General secretion pathway protein L [bacterium 42_11]MBC7332185.1 hypothetical protein [Synergistota bacterium]
MKVCGLYEEKEGFYISRWIKGFKGKSLLEEGKLEELKIEKGERVIFALPARSVFLKSLTLPLSDRGKIRSALPFEMAEELAGETSDYLFSFYYVERGKGSSKIVGGAGKREVIDEELKKLNAKRVELTSSSVAFLNFLIEKGERSSETLYCFKGKGEGIILLFDGKEIIFERSVPPSRIESEAELSKKLLGEGIKEIKLFEDPIAIARGAVLGALEPERFAHLNLLEESESLNKFLTENRREIRRVAFALILLLFSWGLSWGVDYRDTMGELERIEKNLIESYRRYFGEGRVVNPLLQARRKVEELEASLKKRNVSGVLPLLVLEKISESLPASLEVKLSGIHIMINGIELEGTARSFEEVDGLKRALERSFKGVEVSYARLSADGRSVNFGIRIREMI